MDGTSDEAALAEWEAGAKAMAVLRAAWNAGVLAALREPRTVEDLSASTGRSGEWLAALCGALVAHGVIVASGGGFALADRYEAMLQPEAVQQLEDVLTRVEVEAQVLASAGAPSGGDFTLSPAERVAIARGVGPSPLSVEGRAVFARIVEMVPELRRRWGAGGEHLEAGCGVGNALLGFAVAVPELRAVGVEIEAALVAEARRRSRLLAVEDRVEVRHVDAAALDERERFETVQWSQLFFATAGRKEVLKALHRALRPGGLLFAPMLADQPTPTPKASALKRLLVTGWGAPAHTTASLRAELEDAGFTVISARAAPPNPLMISEGAIVAHRR